LPLPQIPAALSTGVAQAPTLASQAATAGQSALNAGGTMAAQAASTVVPAAGTAVAGAVGTLVPPAQTAFAPLQPGPPNSAVPTPSGRVVEVRLLDGRIDMPATLAGGPVTVKITNLGTVEHSLEVKGMGVDQKLGVNIRPGETKALDLTLVPGAYQVFCPIDRHQSQGESVNITVGV
jgi:hypothetical protein